MCTKANRAIKVFSKTLLSLSLLFSAANAFAAISNTIVTRVRRDPVQATDVDNTVALDVIANDITCVHEVSFTLHYNIAYPTPANLLYINYEVGNLFNDGLHNVNTFVSTLSGTYLDNTLTVSVFVMGGPNATGCSQPSVTAPSYGQTMVTLYFRVLGGSYANFWFTDQT